MTMTNRMNRWKRSARGMTLVEIMVVVTILALMGTAVAVYATKQMADARIKQAKTDIHTLGECLDLYKVDKGRYPSTEEGIAAVVAAGKCKPNIKDPWQREYIYLFPGPSGDGFELKSLGSDGAPGGEGDSADIVSQ